MARPGERPGPDPDRVKVARRAGGRPPEERDSDRPAEQAEAVLEESEARVAERAGLESEEPTSRG
jgi:hypothetical protein